MPHRPFHGKSPVDAIMEASPSSVLAVHTDGLIGFVNPALLHAFGYSREELLGEPVEVLVRDARDGDHHHLRAAFTTSPVPRDVGDGRELTARRKDGSEFPVEIRLTPLDTEEGLWVIATLVDRKSVV